MSGDRKMAEFRVITLLVILLESNTSISNLQLRFPFSRFLRQAHCINWTAKQYFFSFEIHGGRRGSPKEAALKRVISRKPHTDSLESRQTCVGKMATNYR